MKYGVIDIGSNSVRLMISENGKTLYKLVQTTRLSLGMGEDYVLKDEAVNNTINAVSFFVKKAREEMVDNVLIFATEAVRKAKNKAYFCERILSECNLVVDVLSGDMEAKIGYLGALGYNDGGVVDVGGASSEISVVIGGQPVYAKSLDVGCVKLTDKVGQNQVLAQSFMQDKVKEFGEKFKVSYRAIGGTATSVASMMLKLKVYDTKKVDGYTIKYRNLLKLKEKLYKTPINERKKIIGLQPQRAEVIASGVTILLSIMEYLNIKRIKVSESDNLEGYLMSRGN